MLRSMLPVLLLSGLLWGQTNYGPGTPGAGGFVPRLTCGPAFMGNAGFGVQVSFALGGAPVIIGASSQPTMTNLAGITLLVDLDPANLFLLTSLPATGPAGVPGAGQAFLPYPLLLPPTPALAGIEVFVQAVVDEGGGNLAATPGLRVELILPPVLFVGTSVGGNTDPVYIIDPVSGSMVASYNNPGAGSLPAVVNNVSGAAFAHSGRRTYVSQSIGAAVQEVNFDVSPPTWSPFWTTTGATYGVGYDSTNDLVYTLDSPSGTVRELVAIDGDLNSPTYGMIMASTSGLGALAGYVERWQLSPDGRRAAVLTVFSPQLVIVDTDPTSPSWMTWQMIGPVPAGPTAFALATDAAFTPDGLQIVLPVQLSGPVPGEVARYDILLGQWIDHNPAIPGVQNIGGASSTVAAIPSAPTGISISRDGTYAIISGFGAGGSIGRLDLDPTNPVVWSYTPFAPPVSLEGAWACAVSPAGDTVAVGTFGGTQPPQVHFLDPLSGALQMSVPIPGASNVYTLVFP